jgi:uncharacterized DUF497 family protein
VTHLSPNPTVLDNTDKLGVIFEPATAAFKDSMTLAVYDDDNSNQDGGRWITLGQVNG